MDEAAWEQVKQQFPVGAVVTGTVTEVPPFGVFVELGAGITGLMLIPEAGLGRGQQTADHFQSGQPLTAKVLWHNDRQQQISLTRRI